MSDNVVPIPTINELAVDALAERLAEFLNDVPDVVCVAALADLIGIVCDGLPDDQKRYLLDEVAYRRAYDTCHGVWVKVAPRPSNVTPFPPKDEDPKGE